MSLSKNNLHIPDDWTPDQASAVLDFIGFLETVIWETYEDLLVLREIEKSEMDAHEHEELSQADLLSDDDMMISF